MKHENSIDIFIIVGLCFNISHNCWFFFLNLEWEHVMIISNSWYSRDQQLAQTQTTVHASDFILSHLCDIKTHCTKQKSVKLKKKIFTERCLIGMDLPMTQDWWEDGKTLSWRKDTFSVSYAKMTKKTMTNSYSKKDHGLMTNIAK